jgi:hypothetical protein
MTAEWSPFDCQKAVDDLLADGWRIVQEGRCLNAGGPGISFADRAEGFTFGLFHYPGDKLFDDGRRWWHLARPSR